MLRFLGNDAAHIESQTFDAVGKEEKDEVGLEIQLAELLKKRSTSVERPFKGLMDALPEESRRVAAPSWQYPLAGSPAAADSVDRLNREFDAIALFAIAVVHTDVIALFARFDVFANNAGPITRQLAVRGTLLFLVRRFLLSNCWPDGVGKTRGGRCDSNETTSPPTGRKNLLPTPALLAQLF